MLHAVAASREGQNNSNKSPTQLHAVTASREGQEGQSGQELPGNIKAQSSSADMLAVWEQRPQHVGSLGTPCGVEVNPSVRITQLIN